MDNLIDRKVLLREMEELYNKRAVEATMTGNRACCVSWNDAVYLVTVAPTVEADPKDIFYDGYAHCLMDFGKDTVLCRDCKHYKQSAVADRKMCFRKDIDGIEVCYDFQPYDSCTYGERKDEVEE